jgi:type IV pilus biogenesis protein CpaD/CtpE
LIYIFLIAFNSELLRDTSPLSKLNALPLVVTTFALLAGCASGSALVTGQMRPALSDHTTVRIMTAMPEGAEEIAIVKASSDAGWTQQGSLNYAVEGLKKQVAKVGANAVVILDRSTSSQAASIPVYGGDPMLVSAESEVIKGIAIWTE